MSGLIGQTGIAFDLLAQGKDMAHVVLLLSGSRREFFVTDHAVGAGCPNGSEDVRLVQFFLKVASLSAGGFAGFQPPGEPPIEVDGRYGRQTQTYISFYQQEVNRREKRKLVEPDGRIDPIKPGQKISSITHTFYTILDLNVSYRARRGDTTRIETDPLFPAQLRPVFFI
jgi:hypothetical protein